MEREHMQTKTTNKRRGFTLLEVLLVVVILGLVAAIALPRLSRGAQGTSETAVASNLAVLRTAIDLFQTEHGGTYPSSTNAANQLLQYSDVTGATLSTTKTATCMYGPYLRTVPALPVGAAKGNTGIATAAGTGVGWIYDGAGNISTNTTGTESDSFGKLYSAY
jgi:general secretion pathway protein G